MNRSICPSCGHGLDDLQLTTESTTAEDIYQAYPRKVAKKTALLAITKALKTTPAHDLLKLTQLYATARQGTELQFTPHPATWFRAERYLDQPATWKDAVSGKPNQSRSMGTTNQGRTYGATAAGNTSRHVQGL